MVGERKSIKITSQYQQNRLNVLSSKKKNRIKLVYNAHIQFPIYEHNPLRLRESHEVFSNLTDSREYAVEVYTRFGSHVRVVAVDPRGYEFDDVDDAVPGGRYGIYTAKIYDKGKWEFACV